MDPNYTLFRKLDDYYRAEFPQLSGMFFDLPQMARQNQGTLIRYGPCVNPKWPQHPWSYHIHQAQFAQPHFAQMVTLDFLRVCHCPPYRYSAHGKCHDFECHDFGPISV